MTKVCTDALVFKIEAELLHPHTTHIKMESLSLTSIDAAFKEDDPHTASSAEAYSSFL